MSQDLEKKLMTGNKLISRSKIKKQLNITNS
jgi:hypothetical protein